MFKSYRKVLISAVLSAATVSTMAFAADTGASHTYKNGKKVIDGGVTYPVKSGKTSVYRVNEDTLKGGFSFGRKPTPNEIKAWDIDVMPDGTGLPEGHGTVEEGDDLYEEKCVVCHGDFGSGGGGYPSLAKGNAYEGQKTLKNQRTGPDMDGPIRVFGTYWPQASTLWWYIKTGMPHPAPLSLTNDQVYALCAYIISINELKIDGEELDDDYDLNRAKFMKIVMPNKDGFVPKIDGPKGLDNVREFFNNYKNYGNGTRCMKDCFQGEPKLARIKVEMKDFLPPMSVARDLPKEDGQAKASPGKAIYESTCAVCHASGAAGAPVFGDKEAWAKVTKKGIEAVYKNALNGKGAMPPRGGKMSLKDDEVKATVDYMVSKAK